MTDVRVLKQRRARYKGNVTRILTYLDSNEPKTANDAQVRLAKLTELWDAFETVQNELVEARQGATETELAALQAENEIEGQIFESGYYRAAAGLQEVIATAAREERAAQADQNEAMGQNMPAPNIRQRRNKPKLPEIKLPEFNGDFTKWIFFKNSFETTIHRDPDLTPMQKHQYLIGQLEGEARQVIQGFTISDENYWSAWTLLKDTYDNSMLIIETHLDALLQFPDITREGKADSIRQFIWHIRTHMKSLEALQQPVDQWETMLIHLAKKKLDFVEQRDWQNIAKDRGPNNMPTMEEFLKFLTERCHTIRVLSQGKVKQQPSEKSTSKPIKKEKRVTLTTTADSCKFCNGSHAIYRCEEFLKQSIPDRRKSVRDKRICINCLNAGHIAKECRSSGCKKCSGRHNTLLHREAETQTSEKDTSETPVVTCCAEVSSASGTNTSTNIEQEDTPINICYRQKPTSRIILSTVRIHAYDSEGNLQRCRALLDPGSQSNLVTANLVKRLKLAYESEDRPITGVGQTQTRSTRKTNIQIKAVNSEFTTTLECLILHTITERLPQSKIDVNKVILPKDARLADPDFSEPAEIDMLIGSGLYWKILCGAPINRIKGQPALQNTKLGWIIGGEMIEAKPCSSGTCLTVTSDTLHQQMERFWLQEDIIEDLIYSEEEKICEKHFVDTFKRDSTGRFIVRLPARTSVKLGESKELALKRLMSLERRLEKNLDLKTEYIKFMKDYLDQKHMSLVSNDKNQKVESYVLPHQAIVRPESVTTKLRVVFDASAKTALGTSLNDKLMEGPNLQSNLIDIILRFRTYEYVVTADVAQMFRQILVDERDRPLQQILWRESSKETVKLFELNTVTYGTSCAPYLAIRCLRQLAEEGSDLPLAAKAIFNDCYMDDVISGARTIEQAIELQQQLSQLLKRGQFHLRKWRSNNPQILYHLAAQCKTDEALVMDKEGALKTLGLLWNARCDKLQYEVELDEIRSATKRVVLSKIAQVFDPLGLLAPVLINGKIIMQELWKNEFEWDQPIPQELSTAWEKYYNSLAGINALRIPRNVVPANKSRQFDIYGFGDASERAYGACLYAVSEDNQGVARSHLICAKAKVAPLKTVSIPRLELEAALLLSRLWAIAKKAYGEQIRSTKLWSDSTIVLGWIKTPPNKLKMYVANRISKIQDITKNVPWYHVSTNENPADLPSRGISTEVLAESELWWYGPHWLTNGSQWPSSMEEPETNLPEFKTTTVTLVASETADVLTRFSTFSKLKRVIAYCIRWKRNVREAKVTGPLTVSELDYAEEVIARIVQREAFLQDYENLIKNRNLPSKSKIRALNPFIDEKGLIKVGGRLRHSSLSVDRKHPVILPARHYITNLIMREEHRRLHHCPPEQLLSSVRYRYWPLSGRREARKVVKNCLDCFRLQPCTPEVKMGDLPEIRVTGYERPFTNTGVDYAGPLQVRESRRRGRIHITKAYIAVFTCLTTRAVHLELVSELTTAAFLAALNRFAARRGICAKMLSDNGTNFVGAARELKEVYEFLEKEKEEIQSNLAQKRITWSFIPPRAPHFGGAWEAVVKITKRHLYTVTKGRILTYEEYSTLLAEIEAILNSRPLTQLSSDPSDLSALTPSHFLIGDSVVLPACKRYIEVSENCLTRWQLIQKLSQQFWDRWQAEYLQELQRRNKWTDGGGNIELNTLVLLKEDHVPPLHWILGRVTALFPGPDGVVRVVSVRTQNGEIKRSVKKLCPIPSDDIKQIS